MRGYKKLLIVNYKKCKVNKLFKYKVFFIKKQINLRNPLNLCL